MALIKPTGLISGIKGNMGGSNFYQGPYGNVMRLKGKRKRRKCYEAAILAGDSEQSAAHDCNQLGLTASGWPGLPVGIKNQWAVLASTVTWYNRFGDPYNPTGYLLFMQWNLKRARAGQPQMTNPEPIFPEPVGFDIAWGTAVGGGPTIDVPVMGTLGDYFILLTVLRTWPGQLPAPLGPNQTPSNRAILKNGNGIVALDPLLLLLPEDLTEFWIGLYGQVPTGFVAVIAVNFMRKVSGQSYIGETHLHEFT